MTRAPHSAVAIDAALERGDAALIAYLPVGFPSVEESIRAGKVLADCGVDVIELLTGHKADDGEDPIAKEGGGLQ